MIGKKLLLRLFDTNCIQRWNDKLRPVDLVELDYQAHRMMIAYLLGKFEEGARGFNWVNVIEGGIFDLLETAVLTDLKWDVKDRLNRKTGRRKQKNEYVLGQLKPLLSAVSSSPLDRFRSYQDRESPSPLVKRILGASSAFARHWEFRILEHANPSGYEISEIKGNLERDLEGYNDLVGCQRIYCHRKYRDFIDLCGELRFQARWSHLHMVPRSSVLGHSMFVATVSYLFSLEVGACERHRINNFFSGLFHDLEETQIRDVRSPLKEAVPKLRKTLQEMSKEMMERKVIPLLPKQWQSEFRLFSMEELEYDFALIDGKLSRVVEKDAIFKKYNANEFNPRSGSLVKAADSLAAFIEACRAVQNGCGHSELKDLSLNAPKDKKGIVIGTVDLGAIYRQVSKPT